jgi:hypothetical protein
MTARDARDITTQRDKVSLRALDNLIEACQRQIRYASTLGKTDTLFTVPRMIKDSPILHVEDCAEALQYHLRKQGFYCSKENVTLYISWRYTSRWKSLAATKKT